MKVLFNQLAAAKPAEAAQILLGCLLVRKFNESELIAKIVETEAYHQDDPASHSYKWKTARTAVMFGPAGFAYVYFTYGMHNCFNVVTGPKGRGEAVLIRAVEPISGVGIMKKLRQQRTIANLTNGPGKLCQALNIERSLSGHNLRQAPLKLLPRVGIYRSEIIATERVGISAAQDELLRFYLKNNPFVSRFKSRTNNK